MKITLTAYLIGGIMICGTASAAPNEEMFQRCVGMKDFVLTVAEQADRGTSRAALKAKLAGKGVDGLIDFVFDFRGAKTNQEIAANIMDNCLKGAGFR